MNTENIVLTKIGDGIPALYGNDPDFLFIVNKTDDSAVISDYARKLLAENCRNFDFYGQYANEWEIGFDDVDIQLHPEEDCYDVALTGAWKTIDDFVDVLSVSASYETDTPHCYLFYDDEAELQLVLDKLAVALLAE